MTHDFSDEQQEIYEEFNQRVNMAPQELDEWLETDDSRSVGWTRDGENEAIGHQSGRRIVEIKHKKKVELTDADLEHMQKVNGYIARHLAQRPGGAVEETNWRYSLMNWGHDPLQEV